MTERALSAAAIASQNAPQTSEVWLMLVTLSHADLAQPIRVVDNTVDITSNGHVYSTFPFTLQLPGEDPEHPGTARLKLDAVEGTVVRALRSIMSPPQVEIGVILASAPDDPELTLTGLTLRNAQWGANSIDGELNFEQVAVEPVATAMTPSMFPGLF